MINLNFLILGLFCELDKADTKSAIALLKSKRLIPIPSKTCVKVKS